MSTMEYFAKIATLCTFQPKFEKKKKSNIRKFCISSKENCSYLSENGAQKLQKAFFWNNYSPKIKHETLCNDYKAGVCKNVDIKNKIIALRCS